MAKLLGNLFLEFVVVADSIPSGVKPNSTTGIHDLAAESLELNLLRRVEAGKFKCCSVAKILDEISLFLCVVGRWLATFKRAYQSVSFPFSQKVNNKIHQII